MEVRNYDEYMTMREELLKRGTEGVMESEQASNCILKLDADNREYFTEFVNASKDMLMSLYHSGFMTSEALESTVSSIDEYATPINDMETVEEKAYNELLERVDAVKLGLYRECQEGRITLEERETGLQRLNEIAESCLTVEDLEEALGAVTEGFIDSTKTTVGKIAPHMMTVKFKDKVMNLKLVVKAGVDSKKFKEKANGIECESSGKVVKDVVKYIKSKVGDAAKTKQTPLLGVNAAKYVTLPDERIFNDLRAKYITTNGSMINIACTHKALPKKTIVTLKYDAKGKYRSFDTASSTFESDANIIMDDLLLEASTDFAAM